MMITYRRTAPNHRFRSTLRLPDGHIPKMDDRIIHADRAISGNVGINVNRFLAVPNANAFNNSALRPPINRYGIRILSITRLYERIISTLKRPSANTLSRSCDCTPAGDARPPAAKAID